MTILLVLFPCFYTFKKTNLVISNDVLATLKIPNVLRISNVIKWYSHKKGISRVGHLHLFLSTEKLHDFLKSPKLSIDF